MAFFDKLAFWKKKDDLGDFGKDLGLDKDLGLGMDTGPSPDLGMGLEQPQQQPFQKYPSFQQNNFPQPSFQQQPAFQASQQPSSESYINSKNLEVISSKLDALRATMESINQRLANIEAIARGEQEDNRRKRYY
ncbi:hypothetical protein HYX07_00155 [Candidatus Woesearchaeota archaeon]|nr:hypothetical protein [Candidatus Woesearchaeota archaeon]